ncbi:MAG: HAD family phosphatase, partial [Phycisphaerales bacterium]
NDADCYEAFINHGLLKTGTHQIKDLIEEKKKIYKQLAQTEGKMIEGVHDFLEMLERNSVPMAICSGALSAEVELVLEKAHLRHLFEVIVAAEHVKKGKPDPEGYLLTLRRLNENHKKPIASEQCVVIEDSHWGLEAAKEAGMHTIAVTNSYDAKQLKMADKIVDRLSKLSIDDLQNLCV